MPSKLIKLEDGTLIEIEQPEIEAGPIAGGDAIEIEQKTIDQIKPFILKAARPFIEVYKELDKEMEIREAELELGLGFEAEGNLFITKTKGNANLTVKLKLAPKQTPKPEPQ